jgi:adenylosuccinate lyase/3-carboxy-cis,cis-muconate cycloisomerase
MDEGDSSASDVIDTMVPEVAIIAASIAETFARLVDGLSVNTDAMARNSVVSNGLICSEAIMMYLTRIMGRHTAHHLLYDCAQEAVAHNTDLLSVLRGRPELMDCSDDELKALVDPRSYIGSSAVIARAARSPGDFQSIRDEHVQSAPM